VPGVDRDRLDAQAAGQGVGVKGLVDQLHRGAIARLPLFLFDRPPVLRRTFHPPGSTRTIQERWNSPLFI
jgi:hypothetical protein